MLVEPQTDIVSGAHRRHPRDLSPIRMSAQLLQTEHGGQAGKDGLDDLTPLRQPSSVTLALCIQPHDEALAGVAASGWMGRLSFEYRLGS